MPGDDGESSAREKERECRVGEKRRDELALAMEVESIAPACVPWGVGRELVMANDLPLDGGIIRNVLFFEKKRRISYNKQEPIVTRLNARSGRRNLPPSAEYG